MKKGKSRIQSRKNILRRIAKAAAKKKAARTYDKQAYNDHQNKVE